MGRFIKQWIKMTVLMTVNFWHIYDNKKDKKTGRSKRW